MAAGAEPATVRDPRPWWRRPVPRWLAALYLLLGVAAVVSALVFRGGANLVVGLLWLVAGALMLLRVPTALRDGVLQVPSGAFGRRRIPVSDVEAFAEPYPFATTMTPSAVLRGGDRVLLRDVDPTLLAVWADATGVPVVRDPKPPVEVSPAGTGR